MRRERIGADQAFFAERADGRRAGQRRSLARARALAPYLGIDLSEWRAHPERALVVVGSKGKGTTATFASATLAAAGLRVGTLTSPGLRSNRERIRIGGEAIGAGDYVNLVGEVARTLASVSKHLPGDGYLSPSGLFTLSALRHFGRMGCDAVVLEAGMGGASDEVSLLAPGVVAVTPILAEHLGVLGDTVGAIATEKAGVITTGTRDVVVAPQPPAAEAAIEAVARAQGCRWHPPEAAPSAAAGRGWPAAPALGAVNARLGVAAAQRLLELEGRPGPPPRALDAMLCSISLPGRLSRHRRADQEWMVDCATNPAAITAALDQMRSTVGPPTAVLTFIPRHRDAAPLLDALLGQPVVHVPGGVGDGAPGGGTVIRLEAIDLDRLGQRVLALGPVYFAGELLATLGADCERSFAVPPLTG